MAPDFGHSVTLCKAGGSRGLSPDPHCSSGTRTLPGGSEAAAQVPVSLAVTVPGGGVRCRPHYTDTYRACGGHCGRNQPEARQRGRGCEEGDPAARSPIPGTPHGVLGTCGRAEAPWLLRCTSHVTLRVTRLHVTRHVTCLFHHTSLRFMSHVTRHITRLTSHVFTSHLLRHTSSCRHAPGCRLRARAGPVFPER